MWSHGQNNGLIAPVLRNIGQHKVADLSAGLNALKQTAVSRSIRPQEMRGATITLSNFELIAGGYVTPIVVPPLVAILGTGQVKNEVVSQGEQMLIHPVMPLSLSFENRAVTGAEAAGFLKQICLSLLVPEAG